MSARAPPADRDKPNLDDGTRCDVTGRCEHKLLKSEWRRARRTGARNSLSPGAAWASALGPTRGSESAKRHALAISMARRALARSRARAAPKRAPAATDTPGDGQATVGEIGGYKPARNRCATDPRPMRNLCANFAWLRRNRCAPIRNQRCRVQYGKRDRVTGHGGKRISDCEWLVAYCERRIARRLRRF